MENRLNQLFDYQKFENNPRLEGIIQETKKRYTQVLSDDDLYQVSAAGEANGPTDTFVFEDITETKQYDIHIYKNTTPNPGKDNYNG